MTTPATTQPIRSDREAFAALDWMLFASISLIWGSSYLLIKIGLETLHPGVITWGRVVLGAAALGVVRSQRVRIEHADRGRMVVLSLVWVGVPFTLFPLAELHISSAATGLLTGATPLFGWLFGALLFGRSPRGLQVAGLAVGLVGVALISLGSSSEGATALTGVIMTLVATACYGYAANLAGPLQHRYGSVATMRWMLALAVLWTAPYGIYGIPRSTVALAPVVAVVVLAVVGTGIGFVIMATLVGRVGGPRASYIAYLIPGVALVLGVVLGAETVTAIALFGLPLVLGGAALASRRE